MMSDNKDEEAGQFKEIHLNSLFLRLFPICRSLTGDGVRQTLGILREYLPDLQIHEVPSGTSAFDWSVPDEWNIRDAFVADQNGNRVIDFKENNLHVVGYSEPVDEEMSLAELRLHLHTLPEQPDAIPYVTSYYKRSWGFCLSQNQLEKMTDTSYRVVIDSTLVPGSLTYADLLIPGQSKEEILFSTYVCHPSMANNELSGPVVTTALAQWLLKKKERRYSYRIAYVPETIGSIIYLSKHLEALKRYLLAGFVVTCAGDERSYSFLSSRLGSSYADRIAECVLRFHAPDFIKYSFLDRGSDERQYCAPGVDLPVVSIMRSKYGMYPEYHTSLDDLSLVTENGLNGSIAVLKKCVELIEENKKYEVQCFCEPQLGKRGLYPTTSKKGSGDAVRDMMNLIAYCDGNHDLIDISNRINLPPEQIYPLVRLLYKEGLLRVKRELSGLDSNPSKDL